MGKLFAKVLLSALRSQNVCKSKATQTLATRQCKKRGGNIIVRDWRRHSALMCRCLQILGKSSILDGRTCNQIKPPIDSFSTMRIQSFFFLLLQSKVPFSRNGMQDAMGCLMYCGAE
jgi:hypothetical protein